MTSLIQRFNSLKLTSKIFLIAFTFWGIVLTHSVVSAYQISYAVPKDFQEASNGEADVALEGGKSIELTDFQQIKLITSAKLNWKPGSPSQCIINKSTRDITIAVDSSTLIIRNRHKKTWFQKDPKNVVIGCTSPSLDKVKIEGAGEVFLSGIKSQELKVEINGVGEMIAKGEVEEFSGVINGAGNMQLGELTMNLADLEINGTGDFSVPKAKQVKVEINGTGKVGVSSQAKILNREINGVGSIDTVD